MKRSPFKLWILAAGICGIATVCGTTAIIDQDGDGMSDVWEIAHGFSTATGGSPPALQWPLADPDHDGRTNLEESESGTDPWSSLQPGGFFQARGETIHSFQDVFTVSWQGMEGKVYQVYSSPDLGTWEEFADPVEGTGGMITENILLDEIEAARRFFWRVETVSLDSDGDGIKDEADLYPLDRFNGSRPLLLVAGEWTVKTTVPANGNPAGSVAIEFRKWPAGAAEPESELLSTGVTGSNGLLVFDPQELAANDRVVARLAGNAQQRVYLPWKPGSETVDPNVTPGGAGWSSVALQALLENGVGTGQTPNLSGTPGGAGEEQESEESGVELWSWGYVMAFEKHEENDYGRYEYLTTHLPNGLTRSSIYSRTGMVHDEVVIPIMYEDGGLINDSFRILTTKIVGHDEDPETPAFDPVQRELIDVTTKLTSMLKLRGELPFQVNYFESSYGMSPTVGQEPSVVKLRGGESFTLSQASFPINPALAPDGSPSYYEQSVIIGPVLCNVPQEVMVGEPFYFSKFNDVRIGVELPINGSAGMVKWDAEVYQGGNLCDVQINEVESGNQVSGMGATATLTAGRVIELKIGRNGDASLSHGDKMKIRVKATLDSDSTQLGKVEIPLEFLDPALVQAKDASTQQAGQLQGALSGSNDVSAPGSSDYQGGQLTQTLEAERKVGLSGLPDPDASTFVDVLTSRFHHGEVDFHLPIPGSDLSLSVSRNAAGSIWNLVSGLRPNEDPLLPFGPGWSSNLSALVVSTKPVTDENVTPGYILGTLQVGDYTGRSYRFTEVKEVVGEVVGSIFVADPTMLPDRESTGITLTKGGSNLVLHQPLLGITHVYEAAGLDFVLPGNRDVPAEVGSTAYRYYRLSTVRDRFDTVLEWHYNLSGDPAGKIVPDSIQVADREALKLRFQQGTVGRVTAFWDPSGVKHEFGYAAGPAGSGLSVLDTYSIGGRTAVRYGYKFEIEADPRPQEMRLPLQGAADPPMFYEIPTLHLALDRLSDGAGNQTKVNYQLATMRQAYSGRAEEFYTVAGDPMRVTSVDLPGPGPLVSFGGTHLLKPAAGSTAAEMTMVTTVTDFRGHGWTYSWGVPQTLGWTSGSASAPDAAAMFFPSLTRSCADIPDSSVTYRYDASAGYSLKETEDAAGRHSYIHHAQPSGRAPNELYQPPWIDSGGGVSVAVNSSAVEPSATIDVLGLRTDYTYTAGERLLKTSRDHRERTTEIIYGNDSDNEQTARVLAVKRWDGLPGGNLLSETTIGYHAVLEGLPVKVARTATGVLSADDPEWVEDLVRTTQIDAAGLGWPVKTGHDGDGDGDLDGAGDLCTSIEYSAAGRVLSVRGPNGGTRSFAYGADGALDSVCYEDGARVSIERDRAGRVALVRDPRGHASGTEYDALGRVVRMIREVEGGAELTFDFATSAFGGVDPGVDIISKVEYLDDEGEVRFTDPRGYVRVIERDAYRRVVKSLSPLPELPPGHVPTVEAGDAVATAQFDLLESAIGPVRTVDPLGYETLFQYDDFGRIKHILRQYDKAASPALYQGTAYGYNADGLPDRITVTRTPLDAEGSPAGSAALEQLSSRIHFDALDRSLLVVAGEGSGREVHRRISYTSTGLPWLAETRDDIAADHWIATETRYDALGRVKRQMFPAVEDAGTGLVSAPWIETVYGADGAVESVVKAGDATSFLYDVSGNMSQVKGAQVLDARSGLMTNPVTSCRYDPAGRQVAVTDPLSRTWESEWDAAGRLRASLGPVMDPGAVDPGKRRAITRYVPSLTGPDQITDAEGNTTSIFRDANGRVRETRTPVTFTDEAGTSSLEELVETVTRDLLGRVERTRDGEGQVVEFGYDGLGRRTSRTWDPDDSRAKKESAAYDAALRTGQTDAKLQETTYGYDARFQLDEVLVAGKPAENLGFTRDDLGRLLTVQAANAPPGLGDPDTVLTYDPLARVATETSNGVTTGYGYDLRGNLKRITGSANARELWMDHDGLGRTVKVDDILSSVTRTTRFGYDLAGNPVREEAANGLVMASSHDRMGRLIAKQLRTSSWDLLSGSRYGYDLNSNVTSLEEHTGPLSIPTRLVTMEYDERGRLVGEMQSGAVNRSERHGYDHADNRTWSRRMEGGVETERTYNYGDAADGYNSNQLVGFFEQIGAGSPVATGFLYDANGNRTRKIRGGAEDVYGYDSFDRLVELTLATAGTDNGSYRYAYDHASRRIGREVPGGGKRHFAFAGSSPTAEWTPDGTDLTENIGGGVGGRLYSYENGSPTFDFHDARGDLLGQTTAGGTLVYRALNDAAGRAVAESGTRAGGYGANSKWEEPGGLVNDGFRYRDKDTGTFIGRDPAGFVDGLNVYNYVGHNPWSMYDPYGLETEGIGYVKPQNPTPWYHWANPLNWLGPLPPIQIVHPPTPETVAEKSTDQRLLSEMGKGDFGGEDADRKARLLAEARALGERIETSNEQERQRKYGPKLPGSTGQLPSIWGLGSNTPLATDEYNRGIAEEGAKAGLLTILGDGALNVLRIPGPVGELVEEGSKAAGSGAAGAVKNVPGEMAGGASAKGGTNAANSGYGHLKEPNTVGPGRKTTPAQRKRILEANRQKNGGELRSDGDGRLLDPKAQKLQTGDKRSLNEPQVDHMDPRSKRGSNSNSNQQVLSFEENLKKSDSE